LGHKALAINLSDLAAAGARPRCFLLDLALPKIDEPWLEGFSAGLYALAQEFACPLVGGDTTRSAPSRQMPGPIVIAITAIGEVAPGAWRGRDGARPGDDLWVSGALGEAALALAVRRAERGEPSSLPRDLDWRRPDELWQRGLQRCKQRMDRPTPRLALGQALAGIATAAIDLSDGLIGDLGHILERSGVGAELSWQKLPCTPLLAALDPALRQRLVLAGGDDYELLFTAPAKDRAAVLALSSVQVPLTHIGVISATAGLRIVDSDPSLPGTTLQAFDHFLAESTPESDYGQ